jgi:hypothetical protein
MNKAEAQKIVADFNAAMADEDESHLIPNPAQVRIARKVLSGKIPEGQVLTSHPVTQEACEASVAAAVRTALENGGDWKAAEAAATAKLAE